MRGQKDGQEVFLYSTDLRKKIPADHPLRAMKRMVDEELRRLSARFDEAYAKEGRPSIPPERLIKASLLQALFSIRSERQLVEQIGYNYLFQWFLDMKPDEEPFDHSSFSQNRERFAAHGLLQAFFDGSVAHAIGQEAVSFEHFSVDGSLLQSFASIKSFRPKGEKKPPKGKDNPWVDFRGEKLSNRTHESKTDPEAKLYRKSQGQEAKLSHSMHVLMENRHDLIVGMDLGEADGEEEKKRALEMLRHLRRRHWIWAKTLGGDKGYDDGGFLERLERKIGVVPHVAVKEGPIVAEDAAGQARRRTRRREGRVGFAISQSVRRGIEKIFAWLKGVAGLRRSRFVGRWKTKLYALAAAAAYNFLRLVRIIKPKRPALA